MDDVSTSKKYATISKKGTVKDSSVYRGARSYMSEKKKPRLYGVLGQDRLDPDDNILMRGNINSKKENSLSLAIKHITQNELNNNKAKFYNDIGIMENRINKAERELRKKRGMNNLKGVNFFHN